jgi:neutral ceramidase
MESERTMRRMMTGIKAALIASAMVAGAGAAQALMAGAGRTEIAVTPAMLPLQDFDYVLDPLHARVVLLDSGGVRAALVSIDLTAIMGPHIDQIKAAVAGIVHTTPDRVWVVASHTFSAPHAPVPGQPGPFNGRTPEEAVRAKAYRQVVDQAIADAAQQALATLQPAELGFATGTSFVNVNRNIETDQGWWQGDNDERDSDRQVGVVRIDDARHQPIAVLVNYAVQPSVLARAKIDGKTPISADLAGETTDFVEKQYGAGTVAMFLDGAAGDQGPAYAAHHNGVDKDGHLVPVDDSAIAPVLLAVQGRRLGSTAVQVTQRAQARPLVGPVGVVNGTVNLVTQDRPKELYQIHATRQYTYNITGKADAPYTIMRVGDVALVGVQVELASSVGQYIKAHSPFRDTLVVTMVNGGAKYLPDAHSYDVFAYQAMNASYAKGSAELLAKAILADLGRLHGK